MVDGVDDITRAHGLPVARRHALGAKGCIAFLPRADRATSATSSTSTSGSVTRHWLVQHNGGVFLPPWGKIEQWLLSVQHADDDVDRFVANVARFADEVSARVRASRALEAIDG